MPDTTEYEREHLEAHVDLCAIRYAHLNERLEKVESAVSDLHQGIIKGNHTKCNARITQVKIHTS